MARDHIFRPKDAAKETASLHKSVAKDLESETPQNDKDKVEANTKSKSNVSTNKRNKKQSNKQDSSGALSSDVRVSEPERSSERNLDDLSGES